MRKAILLAVFSSRFIFCSKNMCVRGSKEFLKVHKSHLNTEIWVGHLNGFLAEGVGGNSVMPILPRGGMLIGA